MAGEILRAILTENSRTRRQKFYTSRIPLPANRFVGQTTSADLQFTQGRYFLWTSLAVNSNDGGGPVPTNWGLQLRRVSSARDYFASAALAWSIAGRSIALPSGNATGEYELFEGDEVMRITIRDNYTDVNPHFAYVTLGGIEYIP
jgi:hypothetical protein